MELLMASAAEAADMLRVDRSGGYRLIVAAQWESIKIGRSQRVSVALDAPCRSPECGAGRH